MCAICAMGATVGCRRAGLAKPAVVTGSGRRIVKTLPIVEAVAVGGNRAAVKIYDVLDDRQTQAHPALCTVGAAGLPEAIENIFECALVDPLAVIGDDNFEVRIDSLEAHLHLAALGRELDRVGQEIPHRLLKPL